MKILEALNEPQRRAVTHGSGPLLVLAGAGSGKTRVLTTRVAWLLHEGRAAGYEITAVTFTNKAAREMRERAEALAGSPEALAGAFLGTFHRWALEILRRWPDAAGLPRGFVILDGDDQKAMMNRLVKAQGLDPREWPARRVLGAISSSVNRLEGADRLAGRGSDGRTMAALWEAYDAAKRDAGAVDFDDMLVKALAAVRGDDRVVEAVRRRARWMLVDEFQDTNRLQMALLGSILDDAPNITAVGDEDQSIYRWRGAEMDNILRFEEHFPGAEVVMLEQNYRSTQPILDASGAVIAHNRGRRGKTLFTQREQGEAVQLFVGGDERDEARWAADRLADRKAEHGWGAMAVLVRTNAQTRPFEEEFTRRGMPYRVVGGLRFWQRAEVKDAVAYLRLVVHPEDAVAFERVVNVPARGIGAATVDRLRAHAATRNTGVAAAARDLPDGLTPRARMALERFFGLLDEARGQRETLDPGDFVGWLLETTGLLGMYDGVEEEKVVRRENLRQLASAVAESALHGVELEAFLDGVALLEDDEEGRAAGPDVISLMTLHAAKGLEFDVVILAGLEDGLLPHANARDDNEGLEEERRLTYVGMTRARRWLGLSAARQRFLFGQRQSTRPSRFLAELPPSVEGTSEIGLAGEVWEAQDPFAAPMSVSSPTTGRDRMPHRPAAAAPAAPKKPRGRSIPATVTDADGTGWRPGDRVSHKRFGSGVVLSCQGRGPALKLVVYFDRGGRKTLVPTIAKLEKI
jgi:DNA helicase-2/ATP-dependent DNA helicase PcrA